MRIRLRKTELIVIALTLMFICFVSGYFTGRKGAVSVVAVAPPQSSSQAVLSSEKPAAANSPSNAAAAKEDDAEKKTVAVSGETASDSSDSEAAAGDATVAASEEEQQQQVSPGALRNSDGRININTASKTELTDLSGIGPALAGRIIDYREKNGSYKQIDDIMKVSGIGQKKFEAIKDKITVG